MHFLEKFAALLLLAAILSASYSCSLFEEEDPDFEELLECQVQDPIAELVWLQEIIAKEEAYERRSSMRIWVGDYEGTGVIIYENLVFSCYLCYVYDCAGNVAFETNLEGVDKLDFSAKVREVKVLYEYNWVE
ncbi:hypothetical protein PBT90_07355 [Algoriphagus halophytocola]|uniref:Lipoprotein n=1 Tax=Algoriphagus halophytocola TaxID=2991499 RepID=A0ABY6MHF1_9BACT|nr:MULTISPECIES: hypothetical protein [unclassified Algoriphagus]UZD23205.1 hypothetical protein OM944_01675 [Algoriphagus sp. TR-M5]WBL44498.1 hypothetical protein PBT90_07355 [Algoriphagus sp. TR-M9]